MVDKLTKQQCIILTGFTGILHGNMGDFVKDASDRIGYPIFTHQLPSLVKEIKELYCEDFIEIAGGEY